jgi:3-hydroxyisobutyrate dehydrogenase
MLAVQPGLTRVGWIGSGVMGANMCGHLLRAGFAATVFNRTRSKAEPLLAAGAAWAESPKAVAEASDVIFTIVGYPGDVRQVILGDDGVLAGCTSGQIGGSKGDSPIFAETKIGTVPAKIGTVPAKIGTVPKIIVDMTTSEPSLAVEIAETAAKLGVCALDAPVSGGDIGAREARLSIMIGGDAAAIESLQPCWAAMGKTYVRQGGPGAGQHTKMVNQILIATNMIGVCEGLLYAYKAGLEMDAVMQSVSGGAAGSWSLTNLGARIIANNFAPGFFVEHFVKDLGIALGEARRLRLCLPGLALANQLYLSLVAHGHERKGTQALQLALAGISNVDWPGKK